MKIESTDALIVVDVQNDFLPGGALPVREGHRVVEPINGIMPRFSYVVATRDWHPQQHPHHFQPHGTWPYHCIADTAGAAFAPGLDTGEFDDVVSKGTDPSADGYSGFDSTQLERLLRDRNIRRVFICGLATDYCVKSTALDAAELGFETILLTDAVAAVNLNSSDEAQALEEMTARGIAFTTTNVLNAAATESEGSISARNP